MSMPERIWRVVRGRWLMAEERWRDSVEQEAARELQESLASAPTAPLPRASRVPLAPSAFHPAPAAGTSSDPLAEDLALLGAPPACDMPTLDQVFAARLAELEAERGRIAGLSNVQWEARRAALAQAYERLRDAINTTETRFEKLEF